MAEDWAYIGLGIFLLESYDGRKIEHLVKKYGMKKTVQVEKDLLDIMGNPKLFVENDVTAMCNSLKYCSSGRTGSGACNHQPAKLPASRRPRFLFYLPCPDPVTRGTGMMSFLPPAIVKIL